MMLPESRDMRKASVNRISMHVPDVGAPSRVVIVLYLSQNSVVPCGESTALSILLTNRLQD